MLLFVLAKKTMQNENSFNSWLYIANLMSCSGVIAQNVCDQSLQDSLKCNISRKNWGMKLIFGLQHQIFLQVAAMAFGGVTTQSQSTQNNKFAIYF